MPLNSQYHFPADYNVTAMRSRVEGCARTIEQVRHLLPADCREQLDTYLASLRFYVNQDIGGDLRLRRRFADEMAAYSRFTARWCGSPAHTPIATTRRPLRPCPVGLPAQGFWRTCLAWWRARWQHSCGLLFRRCGR